MKSTRFDRLLASTALALVLALSSNIAPAQQTETSVQTAVPVPDTSLPPPLTAKDLEAPAKQAAPGTKNEPNQNGAAATAEPTKTGTVPTATPVTTAESGVADKLRELISSKQFERFVSHKADRALTRKASFPLRKGGGDFSAVRVYSSPNRPPTTAR